MLKKRWQKPEGDDKNGGGAVVVDTESRCEHGLQLRRILKIVT
jgi:hypothetical protein